MLIISPFVVVSGLEPDGVGIVTRHSYINQTDPAVSSHSPAVAADQDLTEHNKCRSQKDFVHGVRPRAP